MRMLLPGGRSLRRARKTNKLPLKCCQSFWMLGAERNRWCLMWRRRSTNIKGNRCLQIRLKTVQHLKTWFVLWEITRRSVPPALQFKCFSCPNEASVGCSKCSLHNTLLCSHCHWWARGSWTQSSRREIELTLSLLEENFMCQRCSEAWLWTSSDRMGKRSCCTRSTWT